MKCKFCDEEATIYYTQIVEGQMKKICLCVSCAQQQGIMNPEDFTMADILMEGLPQQKMMTTTVKSTEQCERCGFTLKDLKKVGRLGCSHCYETFRGEILPMLEKMHKGMVHVGRAPEGMLNVKLVQKKLEDSHQSLKQAIAEEKFEKAANLRDEIKQIEVELQRIRESK